MLPVAFLQPPYRICGEQNVRVATEDRISLRLTEHLILRRCCTPHLCGEYIPRPVYPSFHQPLRVRAAVVIDYQQLRVQQVLIQAKGLQGERDAAIPMVNAAMPSTYDSARFAPARPRTAGAPTATSEAILPSASTSTADGVPEAPKARPAANCWSSTTLEESSISLLASSEPAEMNSSSGAASGLFSSHCFISGSICWQKPHPGFQKRTRVCWPLKSSSSTVVPSRSASFTSGAGSPISRAAGMVGAAAWTLPQLGQGSPSVWGWWGSTGSWARSPTAYERRLLMPSAPPAMGLEIFPSGEMSTALGVPLTSYASETSQSFCS